MYCEYSVNFLIYATLKAIGHNLNLTCLDGRLGNMIRWRWFRRFRASALGGFDGSGRASRRELAGGGTFASLLVQWASTHARRLRTIIVDRSEEQGWSVLAVAEASERWRSGCGVQAGVLICGGRAQRGD